LTAALALAIASASPAEVCAQTTPTTDVSARLRSLIERVRARPSDRAVLEEARGAGFEFVRAGLFEEAAALFGAVIEAAPDDASALYGNALTHFNLRRIPEAETLARRAVVASAGAKAAAPAGGVEIARADVLVLLGVILAVKGDNTGALAAVSEAAQLAPENFDAQFALGRALYGAGDPAAAVRAFRAAVALRPSDAQARFFLATALEKAGDDDGALAAYRELVAREPRRAEGHMGVGVLLVKLGGAQTDEGIEALRRAVSLNGSLYEGHVALGRALIRRARAAEAIEPLRRAAELAPENPEPHYQLAIAYRRLGRRTEAEAESAIVKKLHEARRGRRDERKTPPQMSSAGSQD
jgi:Flp pilus assembly protein TadD